MADVVVELERLAQLAAEGGKRAGGAAAAAGADGSLSRVAVRSASPENARGGSQAQGRCCCIC